jgi:iron complex outermembrane receptor protein
VTLRKQSVLPRLDVALSVRNLLDADVTEPSPGPVVYLPNDFPMAGRSIYGELTYTF